MVNDTASFICTPYLQKLSVALCPVLATPIKKMTRGGLAVSQPKYVFLHQLFLFSGKEVNKCSDDQSISVPSDYQHLW